MALGHPVDEAGRTSPHPNWPEERAAPGGLDLIRRFCNTVNHESGADRLGEPEGLVRWADSEAITVDGIDIGDLERIVEFREALRTHLVRHRDRTHAVVAELAPFVDGVGISFSAGDPLVLVATGRTVADRVIGTVALTVIEAERQMRWPRFKACRHCSWAFYDASKNRSGRWCSMSACGGRAKVDAYRRRNHT
ncbi:CGNR zinc finger domain-containing protein [Ilumatobacter nonamiensis]|uniref:CGNR zinc finger domain-containing protein n=1 Tax=Ilumatobacter nonamiensis TaxID=467093 RepID=UPI00034A84E4|nr:CGNR zinc finger domain-containing protein [Ilumatobacter nonamiensis]